MRPSSAPHNPALDANMVATFARTLQAAGPSTHRDPRLGIPRSADSSLQVSREEAEAEAEAEAETDDAETGWHPEPPQSRWAEQPDGLHYATDGSEDEQAAVAAAASASEAGTDEEGDEDGADPSERRSERVQVAVRCRPLLPSEQLYAALPAARAAPTAAGGSAPNRICVHVQGKQVLLARSRLFEFDHAFGPDSTQEEVYTQCAARLVKAAFQGFNATIFAYGQTGSGKTFTMGSSSLPSSEAELGIIPRVVRELYSRVAGATARGWSVVTKVSFVEIYNEELKDLLHPSATAAAATAAAAGLGATGTGAGFGRGATVPASSISIREDTTGGVMLVGVREETVHCFEDIQRLLTRGSLGRTTGSTLMNQHSSRSHSIFTISIEQTRPQQPTGGASSGRAGSAPLTRKNDITRSKFHLVDLAGSERAKRTGAQGQRFKESVHINKGLLALSNVIQALSSSNNAGGIGQTRHVPYRDSKLTRLLQGSLGGNSRTLMLACLSPSDLNFEETHTTLKYASRARSIKNRAVLNIKEEEIIVAPPPPEPLEVQPQESHALDVAANIDAAVAAVSAAKDADLERMRDEIQRLQTQLASAAPSRSITERTNGDEDGADDDDSASSTRVVATTSALRAHLPSVLASYSSLHSLFRSLKTEHAWLLSGLVFFVHNLAEFYALEKQRDATKEQVIALRKEYDAMLAAGASADSDALHTLSLQIKSAQKSYVTYRDLLSKMREDLASFLDIYSPAKMEQLQTADTWTAAENLPAPAEMQAEIEEVTAEDAAAEAAAASIPKSVPSAALAAVQSTLQSLQADHASLQSAYAVAQEDLKYDDEIFEEKVRSVKEAQARAAAAEEKVAEMRQANAALQQMMQQMAQEVTRKLAGSSAGGRPTTAGSTGGGGSTARSAAGGIGQTPRGLLSPIAGPAGSSTAVAPSPARDASLFRNHTEHLAAQQEEGDEVLTAHEDEEAEEQQGTGSQQRSAAGSVQGTPLRKSQQQQGRVEASPSTSALIAHLRAQYTQLLGQIRNLRADHASTVQSLQSLRAHMASRKSAFLAAQQKLERQSRDTRIQVGMQLDALREIESEIAALPQPAAARQLSRSHSASAPRTTQKVSEANSRALAEAEQHYAQVEADLSLKQRLLSALSPRASKPSSSQSSNSSDVRVALTQEIHALEKTLKDVGAHLEHMQLTGSEAGTPAADISTDADDAERERLHAELDRTRASLSQLQSLEAQSQSQLADLLANYTPSHAQDKDAEARMESDQQRGRELLHELEHAKTELREQMQQMGIDPDEADRSQSTPQRQQQLEINLITSSGSFVPATARPATGAAGSGTARSTAPVVPPSPSSAQSLRRKSQWVSHQVSGFLVEAQRLQRLQEAQRESEQIARESRRLEQRKRDLLEKSLRASGMGSLADMAAKHAAPASSSRPATSSAAASAAAASALNQSLASVNKSLHAIEEKSTNLMRQSMSLHSARGGAPSSRGGSGAADSALVSLQREMDSLAHERSRMEMARQAILAQLSSRGSPVAASSSLEADILSVDGGLLEAVLSEQERAQLQDLNERLDDLEVEMEYKRERIEEMNNTAAAAAGKQQPMSARGVGSSVAASPLKLAVGEDESSAVVDPATHRAGFLDKVCSMFDPSDATESAFLAREYAELTLAHATAVQSLEAERAEHKLALAEKEAHLLEMERGVSQLLLENEQADRDRESEFESRARDIAQKEASKAAKIIEEMRMEFKQQLLNAQQGSTGNGADQLSTPVDGYALSASKSPSLKLQTLKSHIQARHSTNAFGGSDMHESQSQMRASSATGGHVPSSSRAPQPMRTYTPALPHSIHNIHTPLLYNQSPSVTPRSHSHSLSASSSRTVGAHGEQLSPSQSMQHQPQSQRQSQTIGASARSSGSAAGPISPSQQQHQHPQRDDGLHSGPSSGQNSANVSRGPSRLHSPSPSHAAASSALHSSSSGVLSSEDKQRAQLSLLKKKALMRSSTQTGQGSLAAASTSASHQQPTHQSGLRSQSTFSSAADALSGGEDSFDDDQPLISEESMDDPQGRLANPAGGPTDTDTDGTRSNTDDEDYPTRGSARRISPRGSSARGSAASAFDSSHASRNSHGVPQLRLGVAPGASATASRVSRIPPPAVLPPPSPSGRVTLPMRSLGTSASQATVGTVQRTFSPAASART